MGEISESANIEGVSRFVIRDNWIEIVFVQGVIGNFPLSGDTIQIKE
jgi:hypothetical protein